MSKPNMKKLAEQYGCPEDVLRVTPPMVERNYGTKEKPHWEPVGWWPPIRMWQRLKERKERCRQIAERLKHLGCSEQLVEAALSWQGWPSALGPETSTVPSDLTKKNTWAELRDGELAKLEENLHQAHEAFNRLFWADGNELAQQVFARTLTEDDKLADWCEAVQHLEHFVGRARSCRPPRNQDRRKRGGRPTRPDWHYYVAWEIRKAGGARKLYIELMVELKAYEKGVDNPDQLDKKMRERVVTRAENVWKEKPMEPPRW